MATNDAHADEGSSARLARRLTEATAVRPLPIPTTSEARASTLEVTKTCALHDLIAGGVAGSVGIVAGHPLDSLKVRMQTQGGRANAALPPSPRIGSVWRGVGAPLATAAVVNASIFATYGGGTRLWDEHFDESDGRHDDRSFWRSAACGALAGGASSLVLCPSEHVKTKLQTQRTSAGGPYRHSLHAARHMLANHGVASLYRGFAATVARQVPGFVVYFTTYDRLKDHASQNHFSTEPNSIPASIVAGGMAGSLSWAAVYPIDVVKSRIQALPLDCGSAERSMARVMREAIRECGWSGLYRGLGVTVMRAFAVNGTIFPMYELTLKALGGG